MPNNARPGNPFTLQTNNEESSEENLEVTDECDIGKPNGDINRKFQEEDISEEYENTARLYQTNPKTSASSKRKLKIDSNFPGFGARLSTQPLSGTETPKLGS